GSQVPPAPLLHVGRASRRRHRGVPPAHAGRRGSTVALHGRDVHGRRRRRGDGGSRHRGGPGVASARLGRHDRSRVRRGGARAARRRLRAHRRQGRVPRRAPRPPARRDAVDGASLSGAATGTTTDAAVRAVADPELPFVTIEDLGILRRVDVDDTGAVIVTVTPTYSGCPATEVIRDSILDALRSAGYHRAEVRTVFSPPWSTDDITSEG